MKRTLLLTFALLLMSTATAQNIKGSSKTSDWDKQWEKIGKLYNSRSYATAFDQTQQLMKAARQEKSSRNTLTAAYYMAKISSAYQEDAEDSALARYEAIMPQLNPVDQAICHAFLAQFYHSYFRSHRWIIMKNEATDESNPDYKLWPKPMFDSVIASHTALSLANPAALQRTPVDSVQPFCYSNFDEGSTSRRSNAEELPLLTPTLYDVLVNLAIESCDDPAERLRLHQQLLDFHASDDECLRAYLDWNHFELSAQVPNVPDPTLADCQAYIDRYSASSCRYVAEFFAKAAEICHDQYKDYLRALQYCDECIKRFPESHGAYKCAELAEQIRLPHIQVGLNQEALPDREMLGTVIVRNADTVYFRIVKYTEMEGYDYDKWMAKLAMQHPLKAWSLAVPHRDDHQSQRFTHPMPAMPAGRYILLASTTPDFKTNGMVMKEFAACDARLVTALPNHNGLEGYLVRRSDGSPIAHQTVKLGVRQYKYRRDKESFTHVAKTTTDENGFYHFDYPGNDEDYSIRADIDGIELSLNVHEYPKDPTAKLSASILPDRSIYKPGDTLSFAVICYTGDGYRQGALAAGIEMQCYLMGANVVTIDSIALTTDEMGICHGRFAIPQEAMPGVFRISAIDRQGSSLFAAKTVFVEAYKQPKFALTLKPTDEVRSFGREAAFEGIAASYSQVPVSGATVKYSITRSEMYRPWRQWYRPSYNSVTVAEGTLTTDHEGRFRIAFTPLPDSNAELSEKPCFNYSLSVDVTDLNGETHSQRSSIRVGYENCHLHLSLPSQTDKLDAIPFALLNLDGNDVAGEVQVSMQRLRLPQQPLLAHSMVQQDFVQTLTREEFARRFPDYYYEYKESQPQYWPVEKDVFSSKVRTTGSTTLNRKASDQSGANAQLSSLNLSSGYYRVIVSAKDPVNGDPIADTAIVFYQRPADKRLASDKLLYGRISSQRCEVGDTLTLQFGSRHKGLTVYYAITRGDRVVERRQIALSDEVKTLAIPVTGDLLGGFSITLFTCKSNHVGQQHFYIDVPYSHKELSVTIASFRDKLQPGETETWSIHIKNEKVNDNLPSANLTLTMYDAALDAYYAELRWPFQPWERYLGSSVFAENINYYTQYDHQRTIKARYYLRGGEKLWRLVSGIESYGTTMYGSARGKARMASKAAVSNHAVATLEEEEAVVTDFVAIEAVEYAEEEVVVTDLAVVDEDVEEDEYVEEEVFSIAEPQMAPSADKVQVRSNLSPLAFFAPTLRTDAEGNITYTFTVPELLTQWSILGLAVTSDLQYGTLAASLVTQKQLMVQPNVPRFLRHGDQLGFMAKVSNISDQDQEVTVTFELSDAASGRIASQQTKTLAAASHSTQPVTFDIQVPSDIFVANYKIVAQGSRYSDGEQGIIPVLSNRELVTTSLSMYMNGQGEKRYSLAPLHLGLDDSASSAEPLRFTLEYSANPIWYAVQALPYMQERENPSYIYLANSLYANSLANKIVKQHPEIQSVFRQWEQDSANPLVSQLEKNADIKQIVLEETPWLRDGNSETERMQRIANFFDAQGIDKRLAEDQKKLFEGQRPDGGWCWMPGGNYSSLYVTEYVLECLGRLGETQGKAVANALAYVDRETYDDYRRYIKHTTFEPVNLEYLFLRSLYPRRTFAGKSKEAYDFFYANALKHYKEYSSLYSRALLALVFQRHGDKSAAKDIIRTLKESALYSDEMGMYWRDNTASCWWYQRPIETQSMLIQAFQEVTPDDVQSVGLMQQWLLKQKQTTSWSSDVATADAVTALLCGSHIPTETTTTVTVGGIPLTAPAQAGTHYQAQRWTGDSLSRLRSNMKEHPEIVIQSNSRSISWGAAYYQYFEDLDKIPASETGISMTKQLFVVQPNGDLKQVADKNLPAVGSRIRVRILLSADRNLEYVQIKDGRASCFEPVSTASGWHWSGGLSYYMAVGNASTSFFVDRLDKGKYILEYDLYVTNAGTFTVAPATAQCLYAPEFRATAPSPKLKVK